MKLRTLACGLAALTLVGCSRARAPTSSAVINPSFDPAALPPVVPTPTDLAVDPSTGLLKIPPSPTYSALDREFIAYLETLDGYPASTPGQTTFSGAIDPTSIDASSVRVLDALADGGFVDVPASRALSSDGRALTLSATSGSWEAGHTYVVALVGGSHGLRGASDETVLATPTWALLRSPNSLVTCADLNSTDCHSVTDVLPVDAGIALNDVSGRITDQAGTAKLLEPIRRHYKPFLDYLASQGVARTDVALLWSFRITTRPMVVFNPATVPPSVPLPTNLALNPSTGLINAPIDPNASPAEQEFFREYINTLTAFPQASTATANVAGGDLDAGSLTPQSVIVLDRAPDGDGGTTLTPLESYDPTQHQLAIVPDGGKWSKGHTFEIALLGGPSGLKMVDGQTPICSEVWALLRGTEAIVRCESGPLDAGNPRCANQFSLAPLSLSNAVSLETIRQQLSPLLDELEAQGIPRDQVDVLWTFSIAPNAEPLFDPTRPATLGGPVAPFPNDLVRTPADGGVPAHNNVPLPPGSGPDAVQLIAQVNSLDGFSTTGVSISETDNFHGTLDEGLLDPAELSSGSIGFVELTDSGVPTQVRVCLNCDSSTLSDGGAPDSGQQQLQVVPLVPLEEHSLYSGFISTDARDTRGLGLIADPAFALLRSKNPLLLPDGGSSVSIVPSALAQQAEPARLALRPTIDALVARGIPRSKLAIAWGFSTQSIRAEVENLHGLPARMGAALPSGIVDLVNRNDVYKNGLANPFPFNQIGNVYVGHLSIADVLTGPGHIADAANPVVKRVPFLLTTPSSPAPASGYPIVIWGHPLTANNLSMLGIANAFATAGIAMISIDLPWHGERTTCIGSKNAITLPGATSDNAACQSPATCNETTGRCESSAAGNVCVLGSVGDLLCQSANQGWCEGTVLTGNCDGPTWSYDPSTHAPKASGWNFLSSNFFATRDSFRQITVDIGQLERILAATGSGTLQAALSGTSEPIDPTRVHYVGMSLGGMVGALAASVSPMIHRVALDAAGADVPTLLISGLTPEARAQFVTQAASNGLSPGTEAFDLFLNLLRWTLDPGDPANHARALVAGASAPADRKVLVQYISNDPVIPTANTQRLIRAAQAAGGIYVSVDDPTGASALTGTNRHAYLISQTDTTLRASAQQKIVNFIANGTPPP